MRAAAPRAFPGGSLLDADDLRPFVTGLAERSGDVLRRHFRSPGLSVETKGDDSPVTIADREAEEVLRAAIRRRFPDHGIIGEEFGTEKGNADTVWVLDPIDGTISYVAGVALFGTLIGVIHRGRPILGAIHQPITRELVIGTSSGTTLGDRPTRVRDTRTLASCTLLTTDPTLILDHIGRGAYDRFEALTREVGTYRGWGDCYGYLLVATGRADAMADPILHPWDLLPLIPVVEGAGGVITTWTGDDPVDGSSAVAASPRLHGEILRALAG
ncbi:MAG: inositol monophosphatase family protein [Gemmatimonadota bacterium]|nr:inositol monophosphatase family protein [Gemmatimonadota bacterium]